MEICQKAIESEQYIPVQVRRERLENESGIQGLIAILNDMLAIPGQFVGVTQEMLIKMHGMDCKLRIT